MIKLEKVNKYFNKNKKNEIHVIDNTSVSFDSTGLVCLLGPSGCGKTTLLNVIGGLDKVKSGKIYVNGKKITKKSTYYVDKERNLNIGYIFQNYNLLENLTVFDNVAIALKMVGVKNKKEIEKRVNFVLETLKIYRYRNRPAGMLSGGEKQRVAIARAIVKNPNILLCDEPTGNLDSQNTLEIMNIIKSISKNRLVILVTHENDIAKFYADRIIEVSDGKIVKDYENSYEGSLDYKIDNKIYLKDFKTKEENGNITLYFDNKIKSNITIIAKNNNIYIKTNGSEKIEVVDENSNIELSLHDALPISNIELINDHYKQIDKSIYEKYEFDFKNIETTKHKYSSIFNVFKVIFLGFKKILDYSFIKKLLLLGFLASGAFIMYAVSNTLGILNVKDSYFIEKNKNYLEVKMQKINIDNFEKYESDNIFELEKVIHNFLLDNNIPNDMKVRTKNIYGIYRKMKKGFTLDEMHDLVALKVVVSQVMDCYKSLGLIHSKYHPLNYKFKDYISSPKTNMYQSLHTSIFGPFNRLIQCQIRTFEMDKANSYGLTGYWDKDDRNVKDNMLTDLKTHYQFFNTICDLNDEYPDNKDFIEHIQKELFSNIIYVFDENGNSIELAKGSTIIDFAYKTKKDFVNVVLGAYVNNNLVGPNYILTNNDRVSLLYNKNKSLSLKK